MSYGIEIYDENGVRTLGMADFTYTKIWEQDIPGVSENGSTAPYNVTVPGYDPNTCVVMFTPKAYLTGGQSAGGQLSGGPGFVPVYRNAGGEVISVIRRAMGRYTQGSNTVTVYSYTPACTMKVFRIFGG